MKTINIIILLFFEINKLCCWFRAQKRTQYRNAVTKKSETEKKKEEIILILSFKIDSTITCNL